MNKKLEEYKIKANRITRTIMAIAICIFVLGMLIAITRYAIDKANSSLQQYNVANENQAYYIDLKDNTIIYQNTFEINFSIKEFNAETIYRIIINIDDENIIDKNNVEMQNKFNIELHNEGKKKINIILYEDNEEKSNNTLNIYYVEPYSKNFLDELSHYGFNTHYNQNADGIDDTVDLLKNSGVKLIRNAIRWDLIGKNGSNTFESTDYWVDKINKEKIRISSTLIDSTHRFIGNDMQISSNKELEEFNNYAKQVFERYGDKIEAVEIWNEPNLIYKTDEAKQWYAKIAEETKKVAGNNKVIVGSTSVGYKKTNSEEYIIDLAKHGAYKNSNAFSYHIYASTEDMAWLKEKNLSHKQMVNELGGFQYLYITEYGISTKNISDEDIRGARIVKQTITNDNQGIDKSIMYEFIDDSDSVNYGIVTRENLPKKSYYSMKNFYQNINGSEYIGKINLIDNVEAHVYDKDGKPIIIAWSSDEKSTYNFVLDNITAKDLYGKDIVANENNQIQITTSPVYLYNVENTYFYQAISNTVIEKYDQFTEKFSQEITKVNALQAKVENLKQNITNTTISENMSIELMKQHYNLGNDIIEAYKSKQLNIEYVKLSSMLDMLDDIGDSFEDLVTVSAKTRNANLEEINIEIKEAEKLIKDGGEELIYPTKILDFSKDYFEKAKYINSLEEENDIKTGLIVSKNLHSQMLANWAKEFANLYIEEYIENNPVEIEYSTLELTNKNVTATIKTNANIIVNNNGNNKAHIFEQNGSFTFNYTIKGQTKQITATVNNIDKVAPQVTEIENERLYLDTVTPKITDENLLNVELYKDFELVPNYQVNASIIEDGTYSIKVTDKAGNETTLKFYISRNPATIVYSETNLTNKDVTATLTSNFDLKVNNNSGKNTYIFKENGTFEFNYTIKGQVLNTKIQVSNIDKTAPKISGVENGKIYLKKVKPIITDENLQEIKVYQNDDIMSNYKPDTEIIGEGIYEIVATDKAGNKTQMQFNILENISEEYQIKDQYILNISNNTTKSMFNEKVKINDTYKITRNEKTLSNTDIIKTGDILETHVGEKYTLIVAGDINKDGKVNISDLIKLRANVLTKNVKLDNEQELAADCNIDGERLSIKDVIRLRILILNKNK